PDGTCIRDYVHIIDLAQAHLDTLDYLSRDERPHEIFNVGTGHGASVTEVLHQVALSTGYDVDATLAERRPGDPGLLVADVTRIEDTLGWRSAKTLAEMVDSAWDAWVPIHGEPAVPPQRR
nr:GDP-mannose 4,6-dehydratase [Propionibacteriales bacterium]